MPVVVLAYALTPLAWLVPNHYQPWLSAWSDGLILTLLSIAMVGFKGHAQFPTAWASFIAVALLCVVAQAASGHIYFTGDAAVIGVYLMAFAASIAISGRAIAGDSHGLERALTMLSLAVSLVAVLSIGVALVQWTGAVSLGLWGVDMPPGGRPYGNVAQPNHLCTICFLGLAATGLLRANRKLGAMAFWIAAIWMVFGMVMTGSRTGWLQMASLVLFVGLAGARSRMSFDRKSAVGLTMIYAAGVIAWPAINALLQLQEGRPLAEAMQGGTRSLHWAAMVDAITREPWWGYGWQQASVAQVRGADTQPFVGEHIEHSHNIVLDLLVWNGLPIGGLLVGLAAWWFGTRVWRCHHPTAAWLLIGIGGLVTHGMLEYPLEYAYFLIPLGLFIGAVDALQQKPSLIRLPTFVVRGTGVVLAMALIFVGADYLKAEQAHRTLRLESARIGAPGIQTPPPELLVLSQLDAFLRFAQTQAREGMTPEEVDWMRKVSERFAYPPAMFRYALATGLNGRPETAALTLKRLCRMHPRVRCEEARESWQSAQVKFSVLQGVPPPEMP